MGCLKPHYIARLFLASDIFCFCIQGGAGGLLGGGDQSKAEMGMNMMLFGLGLQLVFFAMFAIVALRLCFAERYGMHRLKSSGTAFGVIFGTVLLLFTRNIYRIVEFDAITDPSAYVSQNEWMFYVFESVRIADHISSAVR